MPIGTATTIAMPVIFNVPTIKGQMPNCAPLLANGSHVVPRMKSARGTLVKNVTVSMIKVRTIPMVVKTDTEATKNNRIGISFSIIFLLFLSFDFAISS